MQFFDRLYTQFKQSPSFKALLHLWTGFSQKLIVSSVVSLFSFSTSASTHWEQVSHPWNASPSSVGSYANGCLQGAKALPEIGVGYQILRPQRARYYGHPETISFVEQLAQGVFESQGIQILIGDISLPQGGRFSSGHSSHQTGLDVDIWLRLEQGRLSDSELSKPEPISLVDLKAYKLKKNLWQEQHMDLVKTAALDKRVARIFVHPVIKEKLCQAEQQERDWLRKVRPWWGHHYHMHVRLSCPEGSVSCQNQAMPPEGDGCGQELLSWRPQPKSIDKPSTKVAKKRKPKIPPEICQKMMSDS